MGFFVVVVSIFLYCLRQSIIVFSASLLHVFIYSIFPMEKVKVPQSICLIFKLFRLFRLFRLGGHLIKAYFYL